MGPLTLSAGPRAGGTLTAMRVELVPIDVSAAPVLARLMQLYAYDFSELMGFDISDEGAFAAPDAHQYVSAAGRHPFFVKADGRLAGFVIVDEKSRFGNQDAPLDVAEFFILRKFRGAGVGRTVALSIFSRFRGKWEVRQVMKNAAATAFWRRVIESYTAGAFEETISDDERWRGPVQRFDNRGARLR
jgi:predicted acetyltransferase